jgi:glucose/mannose transport system permease protein
MNTTTKIIYKRIILYSILAFFAIFYLMPIYMTIITALKDPREINLLTSWSLPSQIYWQSFADAFERLKANIFNSMILTITAALLSSLIGSLNGYILSKNKFFGSNLIFILLLFGMFIPYQIILIPLFTVLKSLGLYGSLSGLILAHVVYGIPIVTLIFRNYYDQLPMALIESARMDGAGYFQIYFYIIMPLSLPGFVVALIWQCTQIWNEFLWGITLTRGSSNPITVALSDMAGGQAVKWNLPMAGSLIAALPIVIIYIFLSKYFIRGLFSGSVKE